MKLIKLIFGLLLTILTISLFNDINAFDANISVNPVLSNNMKKKGFFIFHNVKPSENIQIPIEIINNSNKTIDTNNFLNDAYNINGHIVYDRNMENQNYKRKNPSIKSLTANKNLKVKLKPFEKKKVKFNLKIPKKGIKGSMLSGINTVVKTSEGIVNYSISILFQNNNNNSDIKNIEMKNIIINRKKASLDLINKQAKVMNDYSLNVEVYKKNNLINKIETKYSMAPSTSSNYKINELLTEKGFYKYVFTLRDSEGNQKVIVKYYNNERKNIEIKKRRNYFFMIFLSITFISIICAVILIKYT